MSYNFERNMKAFLSSNNSYDQAYNKIIENMENEAKNKGLN